MIWGGADIIIQIKCTINAMSLNHLKLFPPTKSEKLSSTISVPDAKMFGDHFTNALWHRDIENKTVVTKEESWGGVN